MTVEYRYIRLGSARILKPFLNLHQPRHEADSEYRKLLSSGIQIGYLHNFLVFSYGENSKIRECFLFTLLFLPLLFCRIK